MDPNETLRQIRTLANRILNDEYTEYDSLELAELIDSLDNWILKGGFLPNNWQK
jgi:hypothetical protein